MAADNYLLGLPPPFIAQASCCYCRHCHRCFTLLLLLLLPGTMSHMPPELLRYGRMSPAVSVL
jgi:hypothetical protein